MKKDFFRFGYFVLGFICIEHLTYSQDAKCKDASFVTEKIFQLHVSPPDIHSRQFSQQVLQNFVHEIDPLAIYFSKAEAEKISAFSLDLSNQNANVCELVSLAETLFRNQLTGYKKFVKAKLANPIDFSAEDFFDYELQSRKRDFEPTASALEKKRTRWLKLQILMRLQRMADQQENGPIQKFEKQAREKEAERQIQIIDHLLEPADKIIRQLTRNIYKAISNAFDPHTEYFTKQEMEDFSSTISNKKMSWGFGIGEDKFGQAVVQNVQPGSSAWKSNAVHKDDLVVAFNFDGGSEIETIDYEVDDLVKMLDEPSRKKLTVTLKRQDGVLAKVDLEKSEIESEENFVQGFVLKATRKFGYISLPAFYTDWSDPRSKGCANDVAKELVKLKKENIEGLILDLRYNGGGLTSEAVDLAGLFVDFGPLMVFKGKDQPPIILKDINRGVAYDGPLIVLINGFSASASELVASALQDYHRAIIVGSTSFGKATGQSIVPLYDKDSIGFVKVTLEKIYRVNGKTHQKKGVKPDVALQDLTDLFDINENNFETALPSDSIVKKVFFTPLPEIPLKDLQARSKTRTANSEAFNSIKSIHDSFSLKIPLKLSAFLEYMKSEEAYDRNNTTTTFQIQSANFDDQVLRVDSYSKELRQKAMEELKASPYLEESIHILEDYIQIKSKTK